LLSLLSLHNQAEKTLISVAPLVTKFNWTHSDRDLSTFRARKHWSDIQWISDKYHPQARAIGFHFISIVPSLSSTHRTQKLFMLQTPTCYGDVLTKGIEQQPDLWLRFSQQTRICRHTLR
jgi:hypothetical protein